MKKTYSGQTFYSPIEKIHVGKYKYDNIVLEDLIKIDPKYLAWAINSGMFVESFTCKYEMKINFYKSLEKELLILRYHT